MATHPDAKNDTHVPTLRERAREHYHDAMFIIRDAAGAAHFWSRYHQAVVVIDGTELATVDLPVEHDGETIDTAAGWLDYTRAERGVDHHRISTSMAAQTAAVIDE